MNNCIARVLGFFSLSLLSSTFIHSSNSTGESNASPDKDKRRPLNSIFVQLCFLLPEGLMRAFTSQNEYAKQYPSVTTLLFEGGK